MKGKHLTVKQYFARYGYIYGVSAKYNFGQWEHYVHKFFDLAAAIEWLHTEEYDFRERELIGKGEIKDLGGAVYYVACD